MIHALLVFHDRKPVLVTGAVPELLHLLDLMSPQVLIEGVLLCMGDNPIHALYLPFQAFFLGVMI